MSWKFAIAMSIVTTFFVTIVLVGVNVGFNEQFPKVWLRSWAIAATMVALAIRFLAPVIKKRVDP